MYFEKKKMFKNLYIYIYIYLCVCERDVRLNGQLQELLILYFL
jgi:hypothetical protein